MSDQDELRGFAKHGGEALELEGDYDDEDEVEDDDE